MPVYPFRCRTCDAEFDDRRPMAEADAPAVCPSGHTDVIRRLPVFAMLRAGQVNERGPGKCGAPVAGSCGGGACGCHAG